MFYWWGFQPNSLAFGVSYPFLLQDTFLRPSEEQKQTDLSLADQMWPAQPHLSSAAGTTQIGLAQCFFFPLSMLKLQAQSTQS